MFPNLFSHSFAYQVCRVGGSFAFLLSFAGACTIFVPQFTCGDGVAEAAEFCFDEPVNIEVGQNPRAVAIGDLDGNGVVDLAVANGIDNSVSVLLGNGGGEFTLESDFAVGGNPQSIFLADVNQDDLLDILTSNEDDGTITILENQGNLSFVQRDIPVGDENERPYIILAADLNGDALLDIIVANAVAERVGLLLFDEEANDFAPFVNIDPGGAARKPRAVTLIDIEGDGDLDIATANENSNNVSILENDGFAGFSAIATIGAGVGPFSITTADLDGDTDPDLLVVNKISNTLSFLVNDGTGEFIEAETFLLGEGPEFVRVANLDGNKDALDLITANGASNDLTPILFEQENNLAVDIPANPVPVELAPHWVDAFDFNNDGVDDFVSANGNSNSISIIISAP